MPWAIARKPKLRAIFNRMVKQSHDNYQRLQESMCREYGREVRDTTRGSSLTYKLTTRLTKIVRGAARAILPNATETKIFCTVNARALRHFLEMRASEAADHEIRLVAMSIYYAVLPYMPTILGDYVVHTDEDGIEYLSTQHVKV